MPDTHGDREPHANTHAYGDSNCDADGNTHAYANHACYSHPGPHPSRDSHAN